LTVPPKTALVEVELFNENRVAFGRFARGLFGDVELGNAAELVDGLGDTDIAPRGDPCAVDLDPIPQAALRKCHRLAHQ
jgi:hypothetical protein